MVSTNVRRSNGMRTFCSPIPSKVGYLALALFKIREREVADCVALFSFGESRAVPVDTHVLQIARRDLGFEAEQISLTDKVRAIEKDSII